MLTCKLVILKKLVNNRNLNRKVVFIVLIKRKVVFIVLIKRKVVFIVLIKTLTTVSNSMVFLLVLTLDKLIDLLFI